MLNLEDITIMKGVEIMANFAGGGTLWIIAFTLLEIITLNKIFSYINSLQITILLVLIPIRYPTNVKILWENLIPIASFDYLKII